MNVACETAAHVTRLALHNHRIVTNSMEPAPSVRMIWKTAATRCTSRRRAWHGARPGWRRLWVSTPSMVRLIAPDVGGARRKTSCTRRWSCCAGRPGRGASGQMDQHAQAALALDADGNFLALKVEGWGNLGAYLTGSMARIFTEQFVKLPGGAYRIPTVSVGNIRRGLHQHRSDRRHTRSRIRRVRQHHGTLLHRQGRSGDRTRPGGHAVAKPRCDMPHTTWSAPSSTADASPRTSMWRSHERATDTPLARPIPEAAGQLRGIGFGYHIKATFGAPEENVELRFSKDGTPGLRHRNAGHRPGS